MPSASPSATCTGRSWQRQWRSLFPIGRPQRSCRDRLNCLRRANPNRILNKCNSHTPPNQTHHPPLPLIPNDHPLPTGKPDYLSDGGNDAGIFADRCLEW